jgi:hypothetical protein
MSENVYFANQGEWNNSQKENSRIGARTRLYFLGEMR